MLSASKVEGTDLEALASEVAELLLSEDISSVGFDEDAIRVVLIALRRLGRL